MPFLNSQFWAPIGSHPGWNDAAARSHSARWDVLARLRPGATVSAAQPELDSIYQYLIEASPKSHEHADRAEITPLREHFTRQARRPFTILAVSVALLMLIALSNAANLLLTRAAERRNEFAIRAALGAGFARLLRQTLAETVVLCAVAGLLGTGLSFALVRILKSLTPEGTPRLDQVAVDSRVLLFALALTVATGVALGLATTFAELRRGHRAIARQSTATRASSQLKNILVAAEFALAMVLVTSSALLIRSFAAVLAVDLGIRPEHVLTVRVDPGGLPAAGRAAFYQQALDRLRHVPSVEAAGATEDLFRLDVTRTHALRIVEGQPPEPTDKWQALEWAEVTGDYFQALGIPLLRGRFFDQRDTRDAPLTVIVNETAARRYWPGRDPIGKRIKGQDKRGKNDDWLTVVGLVKDRRTGGRERQPFAEIYQAHGVDDDNTPNFVIRSSGDPIAIAAAARDAIRETNPAVSVVAVEPIQQVIDDQEKDRRFGTWLIGVFSAAALLLAALGVFAVLQFSVSQKTREIGIRMAVGARAENILSLILGDGAKLAIAGIAIGLLASMWTGTALSSLLFGIKPFDPASFLSAAALLISVGLAACYLPARRAAHLDPVAALRED